MANTYRKSGEVLTFTAGSALASGAVTPLGLLALGIVQATVASGASGEAGRVGVHSLAKTTGTAAAAFGRAFWDSSTAKVVMAPAAGAYFLGWFAEAASSAATTCTVLIAQSFSQEGPRLLTLAATGNQSLTAADFLGGDLTILVPNSEALTVALPAVATIPAGARLRVRKTAAAAAAVTLDPDGSEQIAGGNTHAAIDANADTAVFHSTGAAWVLVDSAIA